MRQREPLAWPARVLLEREKELAAIVNLLAGTRAGRGGVATIEATAGLGKTRLLAAATEAAAAEGMQVLTARGFELERQFTFGVLRQLDEPAIPRPRVRTRCSRRPTRSTGALPTWPPSRRC